MKSLFLAMILASGTCFGLTDPMTDIVFPDPAGPWIFSGFRVYEPAGLGCSYSYKPLLGGTGAITCYVYDRGLRGITTGIGSPMLKQEMNDVFGAVKEAWAREDATIDELIPPTVFRYVEDGPGVAYYSVHKIVVGNVANISISILTGYRGSFLKLRYTYPGNDIEAARHHLRLFLMTLLEANRETIDPLMVPKESP